MARPLVPDALWALAEPRLPPPDRVGAGALDQKAEDLEEQIATYRGRPGMSRGASFPRTEGQARQNPTVELRLDDTFLSGDIETFAGLRGEGIVT